MGRLKNQPTRVTDGMIAKRRYPPACSLRLLVDPDPDHLNEEHFGQPSQHNLRTGPRRGRFMCHQMPNLGEALHHAALLCGNMNNFWQAAEQGKSAGILQMERATERDDL